MKKSALMLILPLALVINACTSDIGSNQYSTSSIGQASSTQACTVVSVRQIQVASDSPVGTLIGGAAGGVAGSAIGGGDTAHILGAIGGAVIGGIAGNAAEKGLTSQGGFEYVVRLDNGNMLTVTQGNDILLNPGQRCFVSLGERARVFPY